MTDNERLDAIEQRLANLENLVTQAIVLGTEIWATVKKHPMVKMFGAK